MKKLNIETKENTTDRLAFVQAKGSKYFILAEEINAIVKAVNELYDSAESLPDVEEKVNAAKIAIFQKLTGNDSGDLNTLQTAVKTHLIGAINSVQKQLNELKLIDDSLEESKDKTYSIDKIQSLINDSLVPMLDKAMAEKTYISKNEFEQLMRGGIAKHRINNIHGVLDSSNLSEQVIEIVGSGFEVFSDNVASISLQNSVSGEAIDGKYVYNIKYIDNEHLTVTFQLLDIVPNGDYYIYLYDIDGGIYKNQLNVGGAGVVKIGGYTQLIFSNWLTNPSPAPTNFVMQPNSIYIGTTNQSMDLQLFPCVKSSEHIPMDKSFDIEFKISDTYLHVTSLFGGAFIAGIIGLTNNSNLSLTSTDIQVGYLIRKPIDYNNGDKAKHSYYSLSGALTELIATRNPYSENTNAVMKIKGSLSMLYVTIIDKGVVKTYTIERPFGNLYIKAISSNLPFTHTVNNLNIGANINCKIW